MWEEYFLPAILIAFILGFLLGVNIGMLCLPKFFEPNISRRTIPNDFVMKQSYVNPPVNPLRYPSGFTAKQLQQHDFTQRRATSVSTPAIGANMRRPINNMSAFNY